MLKCRFRFGRYVSVLTSVYLWATLASIVFPFFMLLSINSEMSLGHTRNLQIASISEGVDTRKFLEDMCQEAEKNSIAIARRTLDVSDTRHGIVLEFCGAENTVRGWEQTGYPSYTPEDRVEVKRFNPGKVAEARGLYNLYGGSEQQRAQLLATLRENGAHVTEYDVLNLRSIAGYYMGTPGGYAFIATCLALSTALIGAIFRQTKKSARLRLHGASLNRVYGAQLLESGPAILCGILSLYALFYIFLALYNSWAFAALTLKVQLILLCWMLGLMLLLHYVACALTVAIPIGQALKGKVPTRITYAASWACRSLALILVVATLTTLAYATQQVHALNQARPAVLQGNGYSVSFNGFRYKTSDIQNLQGWSKEQIESDNVILASAENLVYTSYESIEAYRAGKNESDSLKPDQSLGRTFLYVNREYLDSNPESLPAGLPPLEDLESRSGLSVYYPQELEKHTDDIRHLASSTFDSADSSSSSNNLEASRAELSELRAYESVTRSYTYGDGTKANYFVQNPIIVYVPKTVLTDRTEMLVAAFSQNGAFIKDRQKALDSLKGSAARSYVGEILPVSEKYFSLTSRMQSEQRISLYALIILSVLCLVTLLEYARVYCAEHQQRIARSFTYGMHPTRTFRGVLIGEAVLTILVISYGVLQLTSLAHEQYLNAGAETASVIAVLATVLFTSTVIVSIGTSLWSFGRGYRVTVANHARKEMY